MGEKNKDELVAQYLEDVHGDVFKDYPQQVRTFIKGRYGIYALYLESKLYYVGLASNLGWRLKHHMKDRHAGRWDRFSIYMTNDQHHMKDLESLFLRIAKPSGNKVKGKFVHATLLNRKFKRDIWRMKKGELSVLVGDGKVQPAERGTFPAKPVRHRRKANLAPYVNKGFAIRLKYKGRTTEARVRSDGTINWKGEVFTSPSSAAARAMMRRSANGWWWWQFKDDRGRWVRLNALKHKRGKRIIPTRRANGFDLLVCPARKDGFEGTVLRENRWYAIRINPKRIPNIRYVAFYQTRPVSAITHFAVVASIEPYKRTGKYVVNFKSKARKLTHPVRAGSGRQGPRGPFFSRLRAIRSARTMDEL